MSTSDQTLPSTQQMVDTIVKLDARIDEQSEIIKNQGEIILLLQKQLKKDDSSNKLSVNNETIEVHSARERLPILEKFNGNRSVWDEWHLGAFHKLEKDGSAIGDGFDQFMYIYSRLEGEAAKMVSTTAKSLSLNRKGDGLEFLEYLNTVFGDPNKKARAQQQLYSLKQRDRESFATFLPKFETILATAGWSTYADDQKISLLKNALSKEMRTSLIGKKLPSKWSDCISELLTISSEIIAINQQFRPQFSGTPIASKPTDNTTAMDWEPIKSTVTGTQEGPARRATWVKKETLAFRKKKGLCVRCGHRGHAAPNCNFLPPLNPNVNINITQTSHDNEEEIKILAAPEKLESVQGKDELL